MFAKKCFKSFRIFFFIAIIVTEQAKNNWKALFCQNGKHFGNLTPYDLEGVKWVPKIFTGKVLKWP